VLTHAADTSIHIQYKFMWCTGSNER